MLNLGKLYFRTLLFENFDQKVTLRRVKEKGHDMITSVEVTCPYLYIDLGVRHIIFLVEGDILGIRSIQHSIEYKVVRVDNETVNSLKNNY